MSESKNVYKPGGVFGPKTGARLRQAVAETGTGEVLAALGKREPRRRAA